MLQLKYKNCGGCPLNTQLWERQNSHPAWRSLALRLSASTGELESPSTDLGPLIYSRSQVMITPSMAGTLGRRA